MKRLFTNKKDRATARGLLRKAKSFIKAQGPDYKWGVCYALDRVTKDEYRHVAEEVIDEISDRLGDDHSYVTTWLRDKTGLNYETEIKPHATAYRSLWIDSMIQELRD